MEEPTDLDRARRVKRNPMDTSPSDVVDSPSVVDALGLSPDLVAHLPPELRDAVLDHLADWATPQELLPVLRRCQEVQGPLLAFLDREAQALLAEGRPQDALEVMERRLRRSASLAARTFHAVLLAMAGHPQAARAEVRDLVAAHPDHPTVVLAAVQVHRAIEELEAARQVLEPFLESHPGHPAATIALAQVVLATGDRAQARELVERLGGGVPVDLGVRWLRELRKLCRALEMEQMAQAISLALEQRRTHSLEALQEALSPVAEALSRGQEPDALYRHLSGPERIAVDPQEAHRVRLAAIRHFGFAELRPAQLEIMASVLRGTSVLAVLPTGAGKSLCFQLPSLLLPHATLVISPLIALMKDQIEGLPAAVQAVTTTINSTLGEEELRRRVEDVARGVYRLIYAAPERLRQRPFLRALREAGISLFVIDEAHCVSLWGHDFRPDYLFIQEARAELGNPTALAMTATAPPRIRDEILDHLAVEEEGHLVRPTVIALDIFRPNLHLSAVRFHSDEEKVAALLDFVARTEGSGIVYASTRRGCENLAVRLRGAGISAEAYHAGRSDRHAVQERFMRGETRVVVATVAFGMGIDKADIRFIVHFHPPRSLAAYYQEVGRAGRDGALAHCILFHSPNDWATLRRWAQADELDPDFLEQVYAAIATQLGRSTTARGEDHRGGSGPVDIRRLAQVLGRDETEIRVAVSVLERAGLIGRGFDVPQEVTVRLSPDRDRIREGCRGHPHLIRLVRRLGIRPGQSATFRTADIAQAMKWSLADVERHLLDAQARGVLQVRGRRRAMSIHLPPRPPDARERLERLRGHARAAAQRRIDDLMGYATTEACRHGAISAHFGSPPRTRCTACDNCTGVRPVAPSPRTVAPLPDEQDLEPMILDCLVSLPKPVGKSGLARILSGHLRAPVQAHECRHFGRLAGLGEVAIRQMVDDLLERHLLRTYEHRGYPVLAPTLRGRELARTWLERHPELTQSGPAPVERSQPPQPDQADEESPTYTALQRALYAWRRRTAQEQGVPAYVVMDNELMFRIAAARPQTREELAALPGMGPQRLSRYGDILLDLVKLHPPEPGDEERLAAQQAEAHGEGPSPSAPAERQITLRLQELRQRLAVEKGVSPYRIASNRLLQALARKAPSSPDALARIRGFASSGLAEHVDAVLEAIRKGLAFQEPRTRADS